MEFFRIVDIALSEGEIQDKIQNDRIADVNPEIVVLQAEKDFAQIGCLWGEFTLRRDKIKGGIRYSMLDCPNALAWTITTGYPPALKKLVIHLTINRKRKNSVFVEEINEFLSSWVQGLEAYFGNKV